MGGGSKGASEDRYSGAMENLIQLSELMQQASALLAAEGEDAGGAQEATAPLKSRTSFLTVVALGNMSAGKSAVLNSLIGYPVLPTGENGATRVPIILEMEQDKTGSSRTGLNIVLEGRTAAVSASDIRHSLQGRLKTLTSSKGGEAEGIRLVLRSSTAPPLKLIDIPGLDTRLSSSGDSPVHTFADNNDALLLLVIPATSCRDVAVSRALKLARDLDPDGTRTVGVISKVDQAASDQRSLAAVQALLSGQGPPVTLEMPWVAMIGQSVAIAAAHSGGFVSADDTLETAWKAEMESLKSILSGVSHKKLGRIALVETLTHQIRKRMKQRLPNILSGLQGRAKVVEAELVTLGEQRVQTSEGTRAMALELCREFEDTFLLHIQTGEGSGWRVVASFEGALPKRMKGLPLDSMFELSSVKKLVLEADGYQPYLFSPEKGLRALIRQALDLVKEPAKMCVDEVHHILVDIVSASASATAGLSRFEPLKREIVAIASAALDEYRTESKKMVIALVDMERSFIPPQHFIRLVQRRLDRLRNDDDQRNRGSKKAQDAEQSLLNKATPAPLSSNGSGGNLKAMKGQAAQAEKDSNEETVPSSLQIVGDNSAGYLLKKSSKKDDWIKRWFVLNERTNRLGYTKKPEEKSFRGVIALEECILEDGLEKENGAEEAAAPASKSWSKSKKTSANGTDKENLGDNLAFRISHKVSYKTVLKAHHSLVLKADNMAEKMEWMAKLRGCIESPKNDSSMKSGSMKESKSTDNVAAALPSSASDGPVEMSTVLRRPVDPEEELRSMAKEVRDYVEAVLNSLCANIPKAVVLCQVERAKDAMLNQLYSSVSSQSTGKIEELLKEDQGVKARRERWQKQAAALSKLTRQLSLHDSQASAGAGLDNSRPTKTTTTTTTTNGLEVEDWRVAFDGAGTIRSSSSSNHSSSPHKSRRAPSPSMNGHVPSRNGNHSDYKENGDVGNGNRRPTPGRRPPPPPPPGAPMYNY
ncbi:unnamed protein product [Sphagnum troendelagicum]|uniref:dynamin GTPase n=1 Tax=Sphagnum troendelagicum TaxID=128251 RepID=A0ABP0TD81_9BRYO